MVGNGSVGSLEAQPNALLRPGPDTAAFANNNGTGRLQADVLSLDTAYLFIDIEGAAPGVGHDQLVATQSVALGDSFLDLRLDPNFAPALGQAFVLIDNQGPDPVAGTFNALPEASTIVLGAYEFELSYAGGDGNDVVLTSLSGLQSTQTTLQSAQNPSGLGEAITLTATVSATSGTPTGAVTFRDGASVLATVPLVAGAAELNTDALPPGPRALTAEYLGTVDYGGSASSVLVQQVWRMADVTLGADDGRSEATPNGQAEYLIELRSAGPNDAPGTELVVLVDPPLLAAGWSCTAIGAAQCPAASGSGELTQTLDLPAGAGLDFLVHGNYPATLPPTVLLQAEAFVDPAAPNHVLDPAPGNNQASDSNVSVGIFASGFE